MGEKYEYPANSKIVSDGQGGAWVLCPCEDGEWELWHANGDGDERKLYEYPEDSQLVGDGQGGVWVLCPTDGVWKLWHANRQRERAMYNYPANSIIAAS